MLPILWVALCIDKQNISVVAVFRDPEGILACCSNIPPLVQEYLMELHHIIKDAREIRSVKVSTVS
jgi:hypothetical protein